MNGMSRILMNESSGKVIVESLVTAESARARMRGLLGRSSLPGREGLLLRPCRSIHMWFMRFPIDAAFLDHELRVLKIVRNLQPWRLAWAPRSTRSVVETAAGVMADLQVGDRLRLTEG